MPSYPDEPEIIPLFPDEPHPSRSRRLYIIVGLLFLGFLAAHNAVPLYTDWLWFKEVGYSNVFTTTILAKTAMFFAGAALFFLIFYLNVRMARHFAPEDADRALMQRFGPAWGQSMQRGIGIALLVVAVFLSLWAGRIAADSWTNLLEFLHWTPFNVRDPQFGIDVGFYVFRLPLLRFAWSFLLVTLLLTLVAVVVIHVADRAVETWAGLPNVHPGVRRQLLGLVAALALVMAFGTRLDAYDLLTADNGVFSGAGYTDVHIRLFALSTQLVLLLLTALACLAAFRRNRDFRLPLIGVGAWLAAMVVLGGIVPAIVEKTYVEPNQFTKEQPYIARNIRFTRLGFGLQNVQRVDNFPADESLNAAGLRADNDTLANVRLWDYPYLARVYSQLQNIQNYYKFEKDTATGTTTNNIDVDRYPVGGRLRQVMLAAREMDVNGLSPDAQTWQNRNLVYTHGYGVVMSPVNKVVDSGPDYFIKDIPPQTSPEARNIQVKRPEIYYGQLAYNPVFVDTAIPEFDYPSTQGGGQGAGGSQGHNTTYAGKGGIRIGASYLAKLAFSARLGDVNLLLSNGFTNRTRILFRRDIRERVQTVAPFVQQDSDPYLVVTEAGRLVWIIDCYTLSGQYPYSTPQQVAVDPITYLAPNYIRNSIKATVDAYDGTVNLYLVDPSDPIARTYAKIFPGLLKPLDAMPSDLRAHLRYPEDLFRLQRAVYATYHVDDPRVFYLKEDAWTVPVEPTTDTQASEGEQRQMDPYYIIMRLPVGEMGRGQKALNEEFLLMSPLAPYKRETQNILGWMCARCDGDHYGELVLYRFSQEKSVDGPSQVISRVNSNTAISQTLSLLRSASGGSTATFGNLLVIPIGTSLLYVAPLYVEATNSSKLPQLQKVVVAFGDRVAMENTLEAALARIFPGYEGGEAPNTPQPPSGAAPSPASSGPPSHVPPAVRALIERAGQQYEAAQQKLKSGDFGGYGASLKELESTLKDLRAAAH